MMARGWIGAVVVGIFGLGALTLGEGKPGTVPPVPLEVVFDDSPGRRITSDGEGKYSDGMDGVAAQIDQYGNVILNFQTTQSPMRQVLFDFSERLGPPGAPPFGENIATQPYMATLHPNGPKLQDMPVGSSQCLQAGFNFTLEDASRTQYRISFQRDMGRPIVFTDTSYLVATRTSTTWELEPKAHTCQSPEGADVIKLISTPTRGKFAYTDHGRYTMSVKMTLTAK